MTPMIGITCDDELVTDRRGAPAPRYLLGESYVRAVGEAGGTPVILPSLEPEAVISLLPRLDGVVIAGGDFDVPPEYFGAVASPRLGKLNPRRTAFEAALVRGALQRGVPLLAICGGMQLLNVLLGGTLVQDLSERPGTLEHQQPHDKRQPGHEVSVRDDTRLARALGSGTLPVNSTHHQVLDRIGEGLQVSATAPDGVAEAIELAGPGFALGVQWHPESLEVPGARGVYAALMAAARDLPRR